MPYSKEVKGSRPHNHPPTMTAAATNCTTPTAECFAILAAAGFAAYKNTGRVARTYRVYRPGAKAYEVMNLRQVRQLAASIA